MITQNRTPYLWVDLVLNLISIILGFLIIYCYSKLQVLRKPPGSLILTHIFTILYLQVIEIIDVATTSLGEIDNLMLALKAYGIFAGACYDVFICMEVYLRLNRASLGLNYRNRAIIYHTLSNIFGLSVCFMMLSEYFTKTRLE